MNHYHPMKSFFSLDNHGSRMGMEWTEQARKIGCKVVTASANTAHFLQPCDQNINRRFKTGIRDVRDVLLRCSLSDHRSVQFQLMCAVKAQARICTEDCVRAFCKTGLFPFNRHFACQFKKQNTIIDFTTAKEGTNMEHEAYDAAMDILQTTEYRSRAWQRISIFVGQTRSTNSVLMGLQPNSSLSIASTAVSINKKVLYCGASATYHTHENAVRAQKEQLAAVEAAAQERERKKEVRAAEAARKNRGRSSSRRETGWA